MGGFVSRDGKKMLSLDDIEQLVANNEIEYPIASRDQILDRSKGDAFTRAFVIFQTTWFLLQCVARASQRLALTELELATAAFALLNIVTYAVWWDKPLDVQCPIRVRRKHPQDEEEEQDVSTAEGSKSADGPLAQKAQDTEESRHCGWSWSYLWVPLGAVWDVIWTLISLIRYEHGGNTFFVVGEKKDDKSHVQLWALVLVALIFGGIHCIGWSFHFPSHAEQLLWRMSSIAITGIPVGITCVLLISQKLDGEDDICLGLFLAFVALLHFILYFVSRVFLLVLSLTTLRSLSPSALQTVEWTTFLPHI